MDFYDKFIKLCTENNIKPCPMVESIGIKKTAVSNWKARKSKPTAYNMQKIADYFGVSIDYLKGKTETPYDLEPNKTNPLPEEEERIRELYNLTNDMTENELNALRAFVAGLKANRKQD